MSDPEKKSHASYGVVFVRGPQQMVRTPGFLLVSLSNQQQKVPSKKTHPYARIPKEVRARKIQTESTQRQARGKEQNSDSRGL